MGENENKDEMVAVHSFRIESLERQVSVLCSKITDLLERLPDKYQTKEMCAAMSTGCRARVDEKFESVDEKITELKDQNKWLVRGLVVATMYIAWDLVKSLLIKIGG